MEIGRLDIRGDKKCLLKARSVPKLNIILEANHTTVAAQPFCTVSMVFLAATIIHNEHSRLSLACRPGDCRAYATWIQEDMRSTMFVQLAPINRLALPVQWPAESEKEGRISRVLSYSFIFEATYHLYGTRVCVAAS